MFLPVLSLALAIVAVILASVLGYVGGVSIDLDSIIGALLLVLGAFAVAIAALVYQPSESTGSTDLAAEP